MEYEFHFYDLVEYVVHLFQKTKKYSVNDSTTLERGYFKMTKYDIILWTGERISPRLPILNATYIHEIEFPLHD